MTVSVTGEPIASLSVPDGLPIGPGWLPAPGSAPVRFPFDDTVVGAGPIGDAQLARRAVDEAVQVAAEYAAVPSRTRQELLNRTQARVEQDRDALESLLVLETGKPLRDCRVEVDRALLTLRLSAEEAGRVHGETVPLDTLPSGDGMFGFYIRVPIGVVVGITGFNYPLLLAVHKIGPALAAGCPVICKPAPQTPLATLWLAHQLREVAAELGIPTAAVQVVTGDVEVGVALTTDPRIGIVSFTGSAQVGHAIAKAAAPRPVVLELGSNAAMIVAEDADIEAAARAVVKGGLYASGQACISVQRVLVVSAVMDRFLAVVEPLIRDESIGDPRSADTRVSCLIDACSTERVRDWIARAEQAGARVVTGSDGAGLQPTLLLGVPDGQPAWEEEIFGPVVCVREVPDVSTAIDEANRSRYGLHASIWTRSLGHAFNALQRLEVGGVIVNDLPGFRSDMMPYGGVKDSGNGREGPRYAVEEFTVTRMAVMRP